MNNPEALAFIIAYGLVVFMGMVYLVYTSIFIQKIYRTIKNILTRFLTKK